jgi:hypothetical protein
MVREFKLVNEKGKSFSLMNIKENCLLTEPEGLGYSYSTEYEQLGSIFETNLRKVEQGSLSGILNFKSYDNYKKFVDYIENSDKLRFSYKIPFEDGSKEFFKNVNIQSLSKTEVQENGFISESVVFDCLSLWYEKTTAIYNMEASADELRWNFMWDSKFIEYTTRSLKYVNRGHIDAPILIEINGEVINPIIYLYVEGQLVQNIMLKTKILTGEKLMYGSEENNFYIVKQKSDGTTESLFNLDTIDFENDNVIRLPKNKSCELKITADDDIKSAKVTILAYYKAI